MIGAITLPTISGMQRGSASKECINNLFFVRQRSYPARERLLQNFNAFLVQMWARHFQQLLVALIKRHWLAHKAAFKYLGEPIFEPLGFFIRKRKLCPQPID